jgi:uncharacterized repeat protein (TIGR03803 family)
MRINLTAGCEWKKLVGVVLLCAACAIAASAQTFVVLHDFTTTDFATGNGEPANSLVEGFDGKFYGLTGESFFKIGRYGEYTTPHIFCIYRSTCPSGLGIGSLVLGQYGDFQGALTNGGASGFGTTFRVTPAGALTTLRDFCLQNACPGGVDPFVSFQAPDGSVYGIAIGSGAHNAGTVFKNSGNYFTVLYRFCALTGCADGGTPSALVEGADGNLYGTTLEGGAHNLGPSCSGTVFRLTPSGVLTTIYSFCSLANCADGNLPNTLIQGADGNFYGTTLLTNLRPQPTVFRLTPEGVLTTIYTYCSQPTCPEGTGPAALIQGTDGSLYISNSTGGVLGGGVILKLTLDGTATLIHDFDVSVDGAAPRSLVQGTDGAFYGMTNDGGAHRRGTIYRLDAGLGPFVKTVLTSGSVGSRVTIIGENLTDATAVSFNGTAATFKACSWGTEIVTTVPVGATSGPVTVATPAGTLTSNVAFTVVP